MFFEAGLVDEAHVCLKDVFWGLSAEGLDEECDHAFGNE